MLTTIIFYVLEDCSRDSIALVKLNSITTDIITHILYNLLKKQGRPKLILTDNFGAYELNSKDNTFDVWCRKRGTHHFRNEVHSLTKNGKLGKLFKTMDEALEFCNIDF